MSDALEKVAGVRELALFPLPLVLMPNEVLPLHIFEDRYREMLSDIQAGRNLFGELFFHAESESTERPPLDAVGCAAEVREAQTLPDGRSNILTAGVIRFRLRGYVDSTAPYLVGKVDFFEDAEDESAELAGLAQEVYDLFDRIARAAFKLSGGRGTFPEIPQAEPEPLSFLVTAALNLENHVKYRMLAMTSTIERLNELRVLLNKAVEKIEETADIQKVAQSNGHIDKEIDL
jgi:Lon protease-like protein